MRLDFHPTPLADFKVQKKAEIDATVEQIRGRFITLGVGQAMVYQEKEREALAYLADNQVVGPHLQAEVGITGEDLFQVATIIVFMAAQWREISARIEGKRLEVKAAIDAAANHTEVFKAARVSWEGVINGQG
jgi:hypothetical protein